MTAYYDDSGTHEGAKVLLMGGAIGNEAQWGAFEAGWAKFLTEPTKGKGPIKRFHMYDCEQSLKEFAGWARADSDNAIHNARTVMLESGLRGYSAGVEVAPWNELVTGRLRVIMGDPERSVVTQCIIKTIALGLALGEEKIQFVFDNRPNRNEANKRIHDLFQAFGQLDAEHPAMGGIAFLNSMETRPLQAADVVANEYYRAIQELLKPPGERKLRAHWRRLEESGNFMGEMINRDAIAAMVERHTPTANGIGQNDFGLMSQLLWK